MNTPRDPKNELSTYLLVGSVYFALIFFSFRFSLQAVFLLLLLGAVAALAWFLYFGKQKWQERIRKRQEENTFSGRVKARLDECTNKEAQFRNEAAFIRDRIRALREDLERSALADDKEKARAQVLIKEFEAEFNLRHAKASFFADCIKRLEALLARHQLNESIAARKRELEELRKTNFDDEARMEETRYHLEQDTIQLDTITELSQDIAVSFKAEQAEELRARLEKLRTSIQTDK